MVDPFSAALGKAAITTAAKPTVAALRSQIARRGAEYVDLDRLKRGETELSEALCFKGRQNRSPIMRPEFRCLRENALATLDRFCPERFGKILRERKVRR